MASRLAQVATAYLSTVASAGGTETDIDIFSIVHSQTEQFTTDDKYLQQYL